MGAETVISLLALQVFRTESKMCVGSLQDYYMSPLFFFDLHQKNKVGLKRFIATQKTVSKISWYTICVVKARYRAADFLHTSSFF